MKTKKSTLIITMLIALISISACSVVELETPEQLDIASPLGTPATEAELLAELTNSDSREWQALTFQLEGLDGFQSCRLDDTFIFFDNGTYRYDGGEVLCGGADDARVKTGLWEIDFDNLAITFDQGTTLESTAQISGIEDNRMELRGEVEIFEQTLNIQGIYEYVN
mgnify:CR=1 FL=1